VLKVLVPGLTRKVASTGSPVKQKRTLGKKKTKIKSEKVENSRDVQTVSPDQKLPCDKKSPVSGNVSR